MSDQSKQRPQHKLSGDWYNELGSTMTLTVDEKGGLTGKYNSAVGDAKHEYVLAGRFDTAPPSSYGLSLGWAVSWQNNYNQAHSSTTWSGQYFDKDENYPHERILTNWLLTSSTTIEDVWNSTNIGNDTFVRDEPKLEAIAKAKALRINSPHPEHIIARRLK